jgi:hypothetical protein
MPACQPAYLLFEESSLLLIVIYNDVMLEYQILLTLMHTKCQWVRKKQILSNTNTVVCTDIIKCCMSGSVKSCHCNLPTHAPTVVPVSSFYVHCSVQVIWIFCLCFYNI